MPEHEPVSDFNPNRVDDEAEDNLAQVNQSVLDAGAIRDDGPAGAGESLNSPGTGTLGAGEKLPSGGSAAGEEGGFTRSDQTDAVGTVRAEE